MQTKWIPAGVAALALSLASGAALAQEGFAGADINSDGFVDQQEFYEATNGGSHNVYDRDGDGMLDESEYMDAMNQLPTGGDIDAEQADVNAGDGASESGGTDPAADAAADAGAENGADGDVGSGSDPEGGSDTQ